VDPQRLTAVRTAYDQALNELGRQLADLFRFGFIRTPWLGDDVSEAVVAHYNNKVMSAALDNNAVASSGLGAYQAMRRYETELKAIRDQFAQMEQAYLAAESANAELPRRVE
jgi:hypothetical protein